MAGTTFDIDTALGEKDSLAVVISDWFRQWSSLRRAWLDEKKELRRYVFATDTTKTTNANLPWKNSTTIPKICQIRDNLHANYISALFPHDEWLMWAAEDQESTRLAKRSLIEGYMRNKARLSGFKLEMEKCLLDWIDFGNAFATTEYVTLARTDPKTGEELPGYVGPRIRRISPYDIVFNPLAPTFDESPKIIRSLITIGELESRSTEEPSNADWMKMALKEVKKNREKLQGISESDMAKSDQMVVDGFSSMHHYFNSGFVEVLDLLGDVYDVKTGKLYKDHMVTVIDQRCVVRKIPNPAWRGDGMRHVGWRLRPDNLYAMGPLDNLVGMQYRIDHLENLKSDVFDQYAYPMIKIKGAVEDFEMGPNERIYVGDEGDVTLLRPDAMALQADTLIDRLEFKMEEMAGAPKQAMGIRTPGEKTAFEVNRLENAAGRIFQAKITHFESNFMEHLLNDMLELSRRSLNGKDYAKVINDRNGTILFEEITKEDLSGVGKIYPVGARHFAQKATVVQNLVQLAASPLAQDESVKVHISGLTLAKVMEDLLDLEKFGLVRENIRVEEAHKTQVFMQQMQQDLNNQAQRLAEENGAQDQLAMAQAPQGGGIPAGI